MKNRLHQSISFAADIIISHRNLSWSVFSVAVISSIVFSIIRTEPVITKTVGWEKSYPVVVSTDELVNYKLASRDNFAVIVYEQRYRNRVRIKAAVSFDRSVSFIQDILIAEFESSIEGKPAVSIGPGGKLSVVWQQFEADSANTWLYVSDSNDFGANWSAQKKLSFKETISFDMMMIPEVFFDSRGIVHVFFHGLQKNEINLYHMTRLATGEFDPPKPLIKLDKEMRGAFFPVIYFLKESISVVWQSKTSAYVDNLYGIISSNYGSSWSGIKRITSEKYSDASPDMIIYKNRVHLVYQNNKNKSWSINLISGDSAGKWDTTPVEISSTRLDCYRPRIAALRDDLIITWYDVREKNPQIYMRKYSLIEMTLSPEVKISGITPSRDPVPVIAQDRAVIFWREGGRILARHSDVYVEPPIVYSNTHPEDRWSKQPAASIEWRQIPDESGISGYATAYNTISDYNPTIEVLKGDVAKTVIPEIKDGISYFHIRAIDGAENYSRTVHYRIKTSINPLPMPVIVSPTHPMGEPVKSSDPVLRWALDNTERLKGFFIAVSKGKAVVPSKFTTEFETSMQNLEPGSYFFTARAVDMTNVSSQTAVYNFIVGVDFKKDSEYLKKIAKGDIQLNKVPAAGPPSILIAIADLKSGVIASESFNAVVSLKNLPQSELLGYSVLIGRDKILPPNRINYRKNIIKFDKIEKGQYTIGIRAKYRAGKNEMWTEPKYINVLIDQEGRHGDFLTALNSVMLKKISGKPLFVTVSFSVLAIFVFISGFGGKAGYYYKYLIYLTRRVGY